MFPVNRVSTFHDRHATEVLESRPKAVGLKPIPDCPTKIKKKAQQRARQAYAQATVTITIVSQVSVYIAVSPREEALAFEEGPYGNYSRARNGFVRTGCRGRRR